MTAECRVSFIIGQYQIYLFAVFSLLFSYKRVTFFYLGVSEHNLPIIAPVRTPSQHMVTLVRSVLEMLSDFGK